MGWVLEAGHVVAHPFGTDEEQTQQLRRVSYLADKSCVTRCS